MAVRLLTDSPMWFLSRLLIVIAVTVACFAQTTEATRSRSGDAIEIPLPMGSPRAVQPPIPPLTPKQKAALAFRNTFYPRPMGGRLLLTAWDQWRGSPEGWPGDGEGFAMRFGSRMASRAIRQSIRLGADVAFHTDSRYDLCECTTTGGRIGHAWRRVVVTRRDAGGETVAVGHLAGAFATPWITHTWMPDRYNTPSSKLESTAANLAMRGVTNMLREFWPDIARKTRLPRKFQGQPR